METLLAEAAELGVALPAGVIPAFEAYRALLLEWNQRFNLTAVRDPADIRRRHFLDSLTCVLATGDLNGQRLIDVGTGAGFPGLVLKILFPDLRLTLVESVAKKCRFLEAVTEALDLREVTILAERAERLGQDRRHREQYDWAVARAVAALPTLLEYLLPFCRVGGQALAQKGASAPEEVAAAAAAMKRLGGGPAQMIAIQQVEPAPPYYLVRVPKLRPTPAGFPRRPGVPAGRPLTGAG